MGVDVEGVALDGLIAAVERAAAQPVDPGGEPAAGDGASAPGESGLTDARLASLLVTHAARLAEQIRAGGFTPTEKTSVSDIVTPADHAAERLIASALQRFHPDDGVLGEEGAARPSRTGRTWVIDPVDGTFNFASGMPHWCSAVALKDAEGTVLGAVHQTAVDETWVGGRGLATRLNGHRLPPRPDRPLGSFSLATYIHPPRLSLPEVVEPFVAMASGAATLRMLGSGSVDLAYVAAGRIGAWVQHSTPEWDWRPGAALVEAAGGATAVVEHRGRRWHLAGGTTAVDELVRRLLAS